MGRRHWELLGVARAHLPAWPYQCCAASLGTIRGPECSCGSTASGWHCSEATWPRATIRNPRSPIHPQVAALLGDAGAPHAAISNGAEQVWEYGGHRRMAMLQGWGLPQSMGVPRAGTATSQGIQTRGSGCSRHQALVLHCAVMRELGALSTHRSSSSSAVLSSSPMLPCSELPPMSHRGHISAGSCQQYP